MSMVNGRRRCCVVLRGVALPSSKRLFPETAGFRGKNSVSQEVSSYARRMTDDARGRSRHFLGLAGMQLQVRRVLHQKSATSAYIVKSLLRRDASSTVTVKMRFGQAQSVPSEAREGSQLSRRTKVVGTHQHDEFLLVFYTARWHVKRRGGRCNGKPRQGKSGASLVWLARGLRTRRRGRMVVVLG
jgi:hypothetical protein